MDMKRFTKITWQEAVVKWSNGEHVFSSKGHTYYMKDDELHFFFGHENNSAESTAFFNDITQKTWYVKKPFDVRAEMLSNPDKWVGAFKDGLGFWHKVGFDLNQMEVRVSSLLSGKMPYQVPSTSNLDELSRCVPIDEALEEVM